MSRLPPTWTRAPIGSVCVDTEQVTPEGELEFTYVDIGSVDRLTKRITSPQRLLGKDAPSRARKRIKTGDTLVSTTRPNLNAVALVDPWLDGQIASTGFEVLRAPGLDPRWLGYLVRTSTFVDSMSSLVQGALYPAVRGKDVRSFVAPIAPSNEQRRIAEKLDTVLARVDAVNSQLARVATILKRFRQSVLAAATSGRLTTEASDDCQGTWPRIRLAEICQRVSVGHVGVTSQHYTTADDGVPFLRSQNVRPGRVDMLGLVHITPAFHKQLKKSQLQPGDLLVVRVGANRGDACVVPTPFAGELNCANVVFARPDLTKVFPKFLEVFFTSPGCQEQLLASSVGGAQGVINTSVVGDVEVPLPPIEVEAEIVRRVETLFAFADRLEARLQTAQTATERMTPALLAKAFRGELVPQDPNDEPATELLRRLKADQPASKSKQGRRAAV